MKVCNEIELIDIDIFCENPFAIESQKSKIDDPKFYTALKKTGVVFPKNPKVWMLAEKGDDSKEKWKWLIVECNTEPGYIVVDPELNREGCFANKGKEYEGDYLRRVVSNWDKYQEMIEGVSYVYTLENGHMYLRRASSLILSDLCQFEQIYDEYIYAGSSEMPVYMKIRENTNLDIKYCDFVYLKHEKKLLPGFNDIRWVVVPKV